MAIALLVVGAISWTSGISWEKGLELSALLLSASFLLSTAIQTYNCSRESARSAGAIERATRAQLVGTLYDEYYSKELTEMFGLMNDWIKNIGKGDPPEAGRLFGGKIEAVWRGSFQGTQSERETVKSLEVARREVKGFFHKAMNLERSGSIEMEDLKKLLSSVSRVEILVKKVFVLDEAILTDTVQFASDDMPLYIYYANFLFDTFRHQLSLVNKAIECIDFEKYGYQADVNEPQTIRACITERP
jgi:hypothetical protein